MIPRYSPTFVTFTFLLAALAGCSSSGGSAALPQTHNVVKKNSTSNYQVLYNFPTTKGDGTSPAAGALLNAGGVLYGTTQFGGILRCTTYTAFPGCGTVFSLATTGTERILHRFQPGTGYGYSDGLTPVGGLVAFDGVLYGTTQYGGNPRCMTVQEGGCGTVFSISKKYYGAYTVLHSFGGTAADGIRPQEKLAVLNGVLYGTTDVGGTQNAGTVFSITPDGTETVLHSFGNFSGDGVYPSSPLVVLNGVLYGTTMSGGAAGLGTVFSIAPDGTETVLHSFAGGSGDGVRPSGPLVAAKSGVLYGTTLEGGPGPCGGGPPPFTGCGTLFSITTSGTEKVLYTFSGFPDGFHPNGLTALNGVLYGTTEYTFTTVNGDGTVFSFLHTTLTVLHSFGGPTADGQQPLAPPTALHGVLYGTTSLGGANYNGTVYSLTP